MPRDTGFLEVFERALRGFVPEGVQAVIDLGEANTVEERALMSGPRRDAVVEICREAIAHVNGFEGATRLGISVHPGEDSLIILVQSDVESRGPGGAGVSCLRDVLLKHGAMLADEFQVSPTGTTVRVVLPPRPDLPAWGSHGRSW